MGCKNCKKKREEMTPDKESHNHEKEYGWQLYYFQGLLPMDFILY